MHHEAASDIKASLTVMWSVGGADSSQQGEDLATDGTFTLVAVVATIEPDIRATTLKEPTEGSSDETREDGRS